MVAAHRAEVKPLARRLEKSERLHGGLPWAATGYLGGLPVVLVAGGIGRENATRAIRRVEERWKMRGIVSTGWCGGLDPALEVGEIVVADRVISEDPPDEYPCTAGFSRPGQGARRGPGGPPHILTGPVLTVNRFIGTAEEKHRLRATGAVAVEMEAAAVAVEARRLDLPFFCIRTVSDPAHQTFSVDFNRSAPGIAAQIALSPARWREVIAMGRASHHSAQALGEFLGSCRFDC